MSSYTNDLQAAVPAGMEALYDISGQEKTSVL